MTLHEVVSRLKGKRVEIATQPKGYGGPIVINGVIRNVGDGYVEVDENGKRAFVPMSRIVTLHKS